MQGPGGGEGPDAAIPECTAVEVLRAGNCVCVDGYVRVGDTCVPVGGSLDTLSSDWHPDPDGDGVVTGSDKCPYRYDPLQNDADGDGVGDVCDPDFAPPSENGPVTDLHMEHVTAFGAWFSFRSPRTTEWGWDAQILWSTDRAELESQSAAAAVSSRGDMIQFRTYARFGVSREQPLIVRQAEPDTTYYAVLALSEEGVPTQLGNIVEFTTHPEPTITIPGVHPRVYTTPEKIDELRQRRQNGDSAMSAWEARIGPTAIDAAGGNGIYRSEQYCTPAALLYLVTDDTRYLTAATTMLQQVIPIWEDSALNGNFYRNENPQLANCLDLLWNDLDTDTKNRAVSAFLEDDEEHAMETWPRMDDTDEFASTIRTFLYNGIVACGATDIDSDLSTRACDIFEEGKRRWFAVQEVKSRRDRGRWAQSGGYLPDGSDYGQSTTGYWLESFRVLANVGIPMSTWGPFLRNGFLSMWVHSLTPTGGGWTTIGDVEDFSFNYDVEPSSFQIERADAAVLAFYSGLFQEAGLSEEAAWARWFSDSLPVETDFDRILMYMFEHDGLPAVDYRTAVPTAQFDSGFGVLFDRTSWNTTASYLLFRSGWAGVDHLHGDSGHFQLFRNGRWITHEAIGYDGPAAGADGHNVLSLAVGSRDETKVSQYRYSTANTQRILRIASKTAHTLVVTDTTGVYTSYENLRYDYDAVQRSMLWLKSDESGGDDVIITYDLVDAATDGLAKLWTLHLDVEPTLDGRRATLELPASPENQRVEVDLVYPDTASFSRLAAEGMPDTFPTTVYTERLTVDPGTEEDLRMVTVMRTANASRPTKDPATGVNGDVFIGALTDNDLVLFARQPIPATFSSATIEFEHTGAIRVWMSGLTPYAKYDFAVERNSEQIRIDVSVGSAHEADPSGLFAFVLDGDGVITPVY